MSTFRATLSCKRTALFCRLPLPTLFYRPEAAHLGDLLRLWVRPGVVGHSIPSRVAPIKICSLWFSRTKRKNPRLKGRSNNLLRSSGFRAPSRSESNSEALWSMWLLGAPPPVPPLIYSAAVLSDSTLNTPEKLERGPKSLDRTPSPFRGLGKIR